MTMHCKRCTTDEDFAKVCLFVLDNKHELHRSFYTMDMVEVLYTYVTQAHMVFVEDADNRVIGASAYYHGTPERDFQDKDIAFLDMAIADKAYRGTRLFLVGLQYMVNQIAQEHTEVQEIRLAALADNAYLCRLYSKFTETSYSRAGTELEQLVFCVKINKLKAILRKYGRV
ncbi:hypothetical protein FE784_08350 [Paenibacillus hemerocallicola]|uniref:GNAT family N-acetyltransferase n=1 Tax=Paenibacillus hemerocallicola TaxID=1172614 RepID=A0A5C4TCZ7_9BACL|nr:hypothetical protein [Paenibacillus hemerocallicola]TNJ66871.1 hypothetical protein FE784_08350 [Paenibacillus hemerocallicola]